MSNCDFGVPLEETTGVIDDCYLVVRDGSGKIIKTISLCGIDIVCLSSGVQFCPGGIISNSALDHFGISLDDLFAAIKECKNPPTVIDGDVEFNVAKFGTADAEFCRVSDGEKVCIIYCLDGGVETYQEFGSTVKLSPSQFNAQYKKCEDKKFACGSLMLDFNAGDTITYDTLLALAQLDTLNDGSIGGVEGINSIMVMGKSKLSKFSVNDSINITEFDKPGDFWGPTSPTGTPLDPFEIIVLEDCIRLSFDFYKCI